MSSEVSLWLLSGALFLVVTFSGIIWAFMRSEVQDLKTKSEQKVDNARFLDLESRFKTEIAEVKENSERLVDKLQQRHDKDLEAMQSNFREQVTQIREALRATETNILNQMKMLFTAHNKE